MEWCGGQRDGTWKENTGEDRRKGKGWLGEGNRASRRDVTSSKTSASLLRTSSGSDWKEGTLEWGAGERWGGVRTR